jgi:hypothetical protein
MDVSTSSSCRASRFGSFMHTWEEQEHRLEQVEVMPSDLLGESVCHTHHLASRSVRRCAALRPLICGRSTCSRTALSKLSCRAKPRK